MATIAEVSPAPWRLRLVPASYGGVEYHVEQQSRAGGRRVVLHEYPKRNMPYSEDMGRAATRYQITGYLIGPNYHQTKRALMSVLDNSEGATLIDPYLAEPKTCICERYSVSEQRERGGYCTFEMAFIEVGTPGNAPIAINTNNQVQNSADGTANGAASTLNGLPLGQGIG